MNRSELDELHYITPIANLPSIIQHGLLSHRRAQRFNPASVALQDVQAIRAKKRVAGGRLLHEYVNLYICARNPMLYKRLAQRNDLCVLSVSTNVLDLDGVVVTDMNAASGYVRFGAGAQGLTIVDRDVTFAVYWTDPDPAIYFRKSAMKCAEVLVPDRVDPSMIQCAFVCNDTGRRNVEACASGLVVRTNRYLFFNFA